MKKENREGLVIEFTRKPNIIRISYNGELLRELYFENGVDFIVALHQLEDMNDKEIYDWCLGACKVIDDEIENTMSAARINVKKALKELLREHHVNQDDLYFRTGLRFEDVDSVYKYHEVKRILELYLS